MLIMDRLFGVTTLDVVRASTFVAEIIGDHSKSRDVIVPVVGGHSGVTVRSAFLSPILSTLFIHVFQIVPLLSQSSHPLPASVDTEKLEALTKRIQFGGDEVVKAKDGTGSATLSMAYAGAEFASKVLKALAGEKGLRAPSYVHLDADPEGGATVKREIGRDLDYFSTNVEIGVSWFQHLC
jgi:malate dehydrogenase